MLKLFCTAFTFITQGINLIHKLSVRTLTCYKKLRIVAPNKVITNSLKRNMFTAKADLRDLWVLKLEDCNGQLIYFRFLGQVEVAIISSDLCFSFICLIGILSNQMWSRTNIACLLMKTKTNIVLI